MITIPNDIIRKLPGGTQRLVLQLSNAREPLTGDLLATLCDRSKNWAAMTAPDARLALEPYGYTIKNEGKGYYLASHTVTATPPIVRKRAELTVPSASTPSTDTPPPTPAPAPAVPPEPKSAEKVPHRVTIFRFPWGGFVDLHLVVGVAVERGSLVVQLAGGGYIRAPAHELAGQVCAAITDAKAEMLNVVSKGLPA
jgi:hypothetical protein